MIGGEKGRKKKPKTKKEKKDGIRIEEMREDARMMLKGR